MANRYLSNMRSNASDGYYDTIATMIAADSQTRSAAIQGRYNALSNSITVMADSVVKGMNAAANYQIEQERLITERRKAESAIARDQASIQLDEQRVEMERLEAQARLAQAKRANNDRNLELQAAPFVSAFTKNNAALVAQMSRADNFEDVEKDYKSYVTALDDKLAEAEKDTPGITAAVHRNPAMIQALGNAQTLLNTRGSTTLTDPSTGQSIRQKDILTILDDADARPEQLAPAIRSGLSPAASATMRARANDALRKGLESSDPLTRMKMKLLDWEVRGSPELETYRTERQRGADPYRAFETAEKNGTSGVKRLNLLFGIKGPGGEDAALDVVTEPKASLKRSIEDKWGLARSRIASKQRSNDFGTIGLTEEGENKNVDVVYTGVRRALDGLAKEIANTDSKEAKNEAQRKYDLIATDPTSVEARRILVGSEEGGLFATGGTGTIAYGEAASPYALGTGYMGLKLSKGGDNNAAILRRRSVTEMLERGGTAWIPPNTSSSPQSLVSTIGNFGPLSREASAYQLNPDKAINPDTNEPFRSVEEAVLYEREKRFGSVKEVLARLYRDGYIEGSKAPAGVPEPPSGSSSLSVIGAGRTQVQEGPSTTVTKPPRSR
jgi:hypothetical protein